MRIFIAGIISVLILTWNTGARVEEVKQSEPCIYYGDQKDFKHPASIEVNKIFESHPVYKKIQEKKLTSTQVEYWLLMDEFNNALQKVLAKVAREDGYDLIVEKGSALLLKESSESDSPLKAESPVMREEMPDLTQKIIEGFSVSREKK